MPHEPSLCRHRHRDRVSGSGKRHQEGVPLGVDLLPVPLGERVTKEALVFRQDLRIPAVAETLEQRGGPLDVGEEEGDCPGGQGSQVRPPWEAE